MKYYNEYIMNRNIIVKLGNNCMSRVIWIFLILIHFVTLGVKDYKV